MNKATMLPPCCGEVELVTDPAREKEIRTLIKKVTRGKKKK